MPALRDPVQPLTSDTAHVDDSLIINTASCWASSNAIIQVKSHLCAYILRSALSAAQPYSSLVNQQ